MSNIRGILPASIFGSRGGNLMGKIFVGDDDTLLRDQLSAYAVDA